MRTTKAGRHSRPRYTAEITDSGIPMTRKKTDSAALENPSDAIASIKYTAKRKNIPPAGLEAQGVLQAAPRIRYEYNPHLPPILRSSKEATEADKLPELLATARKRPISAEEAKWLADALRKHEPWLEWSGKREKPWFEVDPVALHMHERISTQAILRVLAREDIQRDLFADPQHDYAKAVQFYQHDMDWANRMILGDSLQVMASLARREDLAGKVQMIYLDPPYGIKFSSNFQPQLGQRDVKDREQDLTREPEMVKAYRDTWTLGIHSYLAYLRDRLAMARELLADTGSIFVQISSVNLHRIRCVMDEVFGAEHFCGLINFVKNSGATDELLSSPSDYIIWFAKDRSKVKYRQLYHSKAAGTEYAERYEGLQLANGERKTLASEGGDAEVLPQDARLFTEQPAVSQGFRETTSVPFAMHEFVCDIGKQRNWKTSVEGLTRLLRAERLKGSDKMIYFIRFLDDFPAYAMTSLWADTQDRIKKQYIVETVPKVVERCLLMTTDPGDLVLDPTCGSGTTAYVAEQWGRRWITCDSSRVALALAKHRLLTAEFDFYKLRELSAEDVDRNPNGTWIAELNHEGKTTGRKMTFQCKTVPHIGLKSIARNTSLDPIFAKHEPILAEKLERLNREVANVGAPLEKTLVEKLIEKHRKEGANTVTDADTRRWLLPDTQAALIRSFPAKKPLKGVTPKQVEAYRAAIPKGAWRQWEVPFDTDPAWPKPLQHLLTDLPRRVAGKDGRGQRLHRC
jgi:adenine-specific DNA-methyltransferase